MWFLAAVTVWTVLAGRRRYDVAAEATLLQGIAAELRSGSSLRHALSAASVREPDLPLAHAVRLAHAGLPLDQVAAALGRGLPKLGRLAASATRVAAATGGRMADAFEGLAALAYEEAALVRERRTAAAPARISAWIVGGIPVVYLLFAAATGRLDPLRSAGTPGVIMLVVGLAFLIAGAAVTWGMLRRVGR